jgi:hypothetical protein
MCPLRPLKNIPHEENLFQIRTCNIAVLDDK